jgi:hypothetical protein
MVSGIGAQNDFSQSGLRCPQQVKLLDNKLAGLPTLSSSDKATTGDCSLSLIAVDQAHDLFDMGKRVATSDVSHPEPCRGSLCMKQGQRNQQKSKQHKHNALVSPRHGDTMS